MISGYILKLRILLTCTNCILLLPSSDFEFMDVDIEASKAMLAEKIDNFLDPLSNAFSCDSIDGFAGFPKEWEQKNWHFYLECVNRCNELASVAWEAYEDFIRTGRRKLCLPFEE